MVLAKDRHSSLVVGTSACHTIRGSILGPDVILDVKTWLSILKTMFLLWGVVAQWLEWRL